MLARGYLDGIAEFLQTRDEPAHLHGLGPAVEVVGTEIVVESAVIEHVVGGGEDRRRRERRAGGQAMELGLKIAGVFAGGRPDARIKVVLSQGVPLRVRLDRRLPALSSFLGHRPAQEIRSPTVGKQLMSLPISARMTWALKSLTTEMAVGSRTAVRKGSTWVATSRSIAPMASSRASICRRCSCSRKWW